MQPNFKMDVDPTYTMAYLCSDVMINVLEYVPFVNQMLLWQTGDRSWQKLYKNWVQEYGTTFDFDTTLYTELISCNKSARQLYEEQPKSDLELEFEAFVGPEEYAKYQRERELEMLSKCSPYKPLPDLLTKIPVWFNFKKIVIEPHVSIDYELENGFVIRYYHAYPGEAKYKTTLQDLVWKSRDKLEVFETKNSCDWMFNLLSKIDDSGKKCFSALYKFRCRHANCYCLCSGIFSREIENFVNFSDLKVPTGYMTYYAGVNKILSLDYDSLDSNFKMVNKICIVESVMAFSMCNCIELLMQKSSNGARLLPNLRSIEFAVIHKYPTTFNNSMKNFEHLMQNNILKIVITGYCSEHYNAVANDPNIYAIAIKNVLDRLVN
jgi:hypothetical protein